MKSDLSLLPRMTIHPSKIVCYNEVHWDPVKPSKACLPLSQAKSEQVEKHLLNSKRSAQGLISNSARKKIQTAIDYLLVTAKPTRQFNETTRRHFDFKASFITLDLPSAQIHSDNEIKEICLNQMLTEFRDNFKVKNYVWRAEKQKNGNIHFHIILDKFIPYKILRYSWNRIIEKLGYVSRYREAQLEWHKDGFKARENLLLRFDKKTKQWVDNWTLKAQKQAYRNGMTENWCNPNSTDIHCLQFIQNVKAYFCKYMLKDPELPDEPGNDASELTMAEYDRQIINLLVHGRIWGCNTALSNITGCQLYVDSQMSSELTSLVKSTNCFKVEEEYYSVYYIKFDQLKGRLSPNLFKYFTEYLSRTFHYQYQTDLFYPT